MKINLGTYINLFTDFGFKKLFGQEDSKDLLIDFLNALLLEKEDKIVDIIYIKSEHLGRTESDRKAIFDIHCKTINGEFFVVEMQNAKQEFFKDRTIYYATFPIQNQAIKDSKKNGIQWTYELKSVYSIAIMNFKFDDSNPIQKVKHHIMLKDIEDNTIFYDKLQFIYLEMPNFNKKVQNLTTRYEKWLYVLKNIPKLQSLPPTLQDEIFMKVFAKSQISSYTNEELNEYESSLKNLIDFTNSVATAEKEGKIEGEKIGIIKGKIEGEKTGIIKGKVEVALNAIKKGFDNQTIQDLTGLTAQEIIKIRKENI